MQINNNCGLGTNVVTMKATSGSIIFALLESTPGN